MRWRLVDGWVVPDRRWRRWGWLAVAAIVAALAACSSSSPRPTLRGDAADRVAVDRGLLANPQVVDSGG